MVSLLQVFGDHSRPKSSQQPLLYMCAISRQSVPRPGAIFSLGYISHLRMLAQLAGTSKRVMVSHPVLNSHGHYTRTLEKTSRPFPACCAIVTAERVWPRETRHAHVHVLIPSFLSSNGCQRPIRLQVELRDCSCMQLCSIFAVTLTLPLFLMTQC